MNSTAITTAITIANNNDDFEEFLLTQINTSNSNYFKIYKLNYSINMNKFIKILKLKPFYKNKIPITQNLDISSSQVIDKECAICYEKIQMNVYLRRLECNHEFHKKCIDKWFHKCKDDYIHCPICRKLYDLPLEKITSFELKQ